MTPGTLVLLHSPLTTAAAWGTLPDALRSRGLDVAVPQVGDDDRPPYASRYVARAALEIAAREPAQPLVLVAHSAAGPLLPPLGAAQRAAHRRVGGYLFCDAGLPAQGETTRLEQIRLERPDQAQGFEEFLDAGGRFPDSPAPAGLADDIRPRGRDFFAEPLPPAQDWPDHQARLRGWPVVERDSGHFAAHTDPDGTATAVLELIAAM